MKLIVAIIQDEDTQQLVDRLTEEKISSTKLASTGGFLKSGNTTLLIGLEKEKVDYVISIIEEECKSRTRVTSTPITTTWLPSAYIPQTIEVPVGGATVFVLDVDKFVKA